MDLARTEEMRQAIVNEEKRRRDHGFKRSVIPPTPTAEVQESNEIEVEGQATANAEEEAEDEDSGSSDEEDENWMLVVVLFEVVANQYQYQ